MTDTRIPIPKYFLPFFGMVAAIVPFAIDAYLPAIPTMAGYFDVDTVFMNNTISVFLLGYGVGQFLGGPMSDQVGRKTIGLGGMTLFMLCTLGIILSQSVNQIIALRFFQAIGGGFTSVIIMSSMRDVYPAHEAGRKYSVVMMIMLIMPLLAPIIGSQLLPFGWRTIFIALFAFVLIAAVMFKFGIPETRVTDTKRVDFGSIARQFKQVVKKKNDEGMFAMFYVLAMSFNVGLLLSFVTNASDIYQGYFGVSTTMFPYFFGANTTLMMVCIWYSMRRMKVKHPHRLFVRGNLIQFTFCTLTYLYVLFFEPQLEVMTVLIILSIGSMGLVNPNGFAVYISYYDRLSGSATSLSSLMLLAMGAITGTMVGLFKDGSLVPFATAVFACALFSNIISLSMPRPIGPFKKDEQ
ncbi:MAG: multidrug effflux MFS transporter [Flavobacteriales bacterium]|nr:multidrug effflux MFS transporter [Flavobacteriales bacterium]